MTMIMAPAGARTKELLSRWKHESRQRLYASFLAADTAWEAELRRIYGDEAIQARGEARGQGVSGSGLRRAYNRRADAYQRWRDQAHISY